MGRRGEGPPRPRGRRAALPSDAKPGDATAARPRPLTLALAALPGLLLLAVVLAPPVNHDAAAVLGFARRWLEGERLYLDLIDVNPPLIFLLNLAPAALAAWTPVPPVLALQLCVLAVCLLALGLAWRVLALPDGGGEPGARGPVERAALLAGLPLLTLAAGYDFAQREHLMVVAALPWLLLAARRAEGVAPPAGRGLAVAVALLAATGFALKPHFLAIPALVEALVLAGRWRGGLRGRALLADPTPWAMAAAWVGYLLVIALAFPAYAGSILPLVFGLYLEAGLPWWQVALDDRMGSALLALLPLAALAFAGRAGALPRAAALAALGAALAALVQGRGWTYHVLPVLLFTGLLGLVLVARGLDRAGGARLPVAGTTAALCFGLLLFVLARAEAPWREINWPRSEAAALARALPAGRVLVLSPFIHPVWPALAHAGATTTLGSMSTWLLQGLYAGCPADAAAPRFRAPEAMGAVERAFFERTIADFVRDPPDAVLVSRNPGIPDCGGTRFDLLGYVLRDPRFGAVFRRYRPAGPAGAEGYALYLRER
jgi:hypothetical protein